VTTSAAALREGLTRSEWTVTDLWRAALGVGGAFTRHDVDRFVRGAPGATQAEHDILASAFNDHFFDRHDVQPVRYWRDLGH
jgi:hypothetical protein